MKKFLTLIAAGLVAATAVFAGEFPDISISEVKKLAKSHQAVIIDVNGSESYANGHVPGALDFSTIEGKLAASLPADKNALIVAYCGGPKCSAYQAAAKAAQKWTITIASGTSYTTTQTIKSNEVAVYRAVPVGAP